MRHYLRPAIVGLFLSLASWCSLQASTLAGFSHDEALAYSQAAIGGVLSDVGLLDADGKPLSLEQYRGKPLVISLIFTSCHHICPATTSHLQTAVQKAREALDEDSFHVVSVGFDAPFDSPARMQQFRNRNGVKDQRWDFLAGTDAQIEKLIGQLGFIYTPSSRGFDHLIQTSIIDAEGSVYRQVYGINFPTPQLIEPLKDLVFGTPGKQSTLDYLTNRIRLFCTVYDPATDSYRVDISVFIGTGVGILVSLLFGSLLFKEWRRSIKSGR